jgi:hypothetical protein
VYASLPVGHLPMHGMYLMLATAQEQLSLTHYFISYSFFVRSGSAPGLHDHKSNWRPSPRRRPPPPLRYRAPHAARSRDHQQQGQGGLWFDHGIGHQRKRDQHTKLGKTTVWTQEWTYFTFNSYYLHLRMMNSS